jgi:starch phosphorylase
MRKTEQMYQQAQELAADLAALWNGGEAVLQDIARTMGRSDGNAWAALRSMSSEDVERIFGDADRCERVQRAAHALATYHRAPTWFDHAATSDPALALLRRHPIAYFCAEFGLTSWLPLYSGGLGVLAGDVLKQASDLGLPMVGVGLLYQFGFFQQWLDPFGWQHESYPPLQPETLPLTRVVGADGQEVRIAVPIADHDVYARIWRLTVGRSSLLLLDTNLEENERLEDRLITGHLYGGTQDTRIRQEIVLGVGGVRALAALGIEPAIYSMNEGHAAFLALELLRTATRGGAGRESMPSHHPPMATLPSVQQKVLYTNHTVVPAGNDRFPRDLAARYLAPLARELGTDVENLLNLGADPRDGRFSMAYLAFRTAGRANAVSRRHAEIIPQHWPGFDIVAVTNGVHLPTWLGPAMTSLLEQFVPQWRDATPPTWQRIEQIDAALLWQRHTQQRRTLIEWLNAHSTAHFDPNILTLVWARRVAGYKRLELLTADSERLARIVGHPQRPMQVIVAGKAHPQDEAAKQTLQAFLERIRSIPLLRDRVVFIPNYDLDIARRLVAGADVWINTPRPPLEASGTSGMKAGVNGALALTVPDGWAAELDWRDRGWVIDGEWSDDERAEICTLYDLLEFEIAPCFYDRDQDGLPHAWIAAMKSSMSAIGGHYSTRRMLLEYIDKLYRPLLTRPSRGEVVAAE